MDIQNFQQALEKQNILLSSHQLEQFEVYYQTLIEWNEKMNLTAITERGDVYLKHFFDSISAAFYFDFTKVQSVCDVGAGAGFPSIPIKICFPHLEVTIVDSLNKRIGFLEHLSKQVGLNHVQFYHDRAETFAQNKNFRESFDAVTARAVARLNVLSELCLPLVKEQGYFVAMKGANTPDEIEDAKPAIRKLGGVLEDVQAFKLPIEDSERYIIRVFKESATPKKYPRKPGTPNRDPLT